jgi:hypothetical protein
MSLKKEYQRKNRNDRQLRFLSVSLLLANFDSQRYAKGDLLMSERHARHRKQCEAVYHCGIGQILASAYKREFTLQDPLAVDPTVCRRQMYSQCTSGSWILGHLIDGCQAEYVRVLRANMGMYRMYRIPDGLTEEDVLFVGDILSTGYFVQTPFFSDSISVNDTAPLGFFRLANG